MKKQPLSIFCLGPKGSYGSEAAKQTIEKLKILIPEIEWVVEFTPDNISILERAMEAKGVAIIPVENGRQGPVVEIMAWRLGQTTFPLQVIGEIRLPIRHHLLVKKGTTLDSITHVVSHTQALGQCRLTLRNKGLIQTIDVSSTAAAAENLAKGEYPKTYAVIASFDACEEYGLESLGEVADAPSNETLFHICASLKTVTQNPKKTIYMFDLPNNANALLDALRVMDTINHTSIHSIPTGTLGIYSFYMESEISYDDANMWRFDQLRKVVNNLRILGSF